MNKQNYDITYIRRYVNGELSPAEMYALERAAHEDEILMDIIIGIEFERSNNLPNSIDEVHQLIKDRVHQQKNKKPSVRFGWAIAASLITALGITAWIFYFNNAFRNPESPIASIPAPAHTDETNNTAPTESTPVPDSMTTPTAERVIAHKETLPKKKKPTTEYPLIDSTEIISSEHLIALAPISHLPKAAELTSPRIKPELSVSEVEEVTIDIIPRRHEQISIQNPPVTLLENKKSLARVEQNKNIESIGRTRAKISSMHIDPETSMILNRVLDQQDRERQNQLEINQAEQKNVALDLAEQDHTYLASIKTDTYVGKNKRTKNEVSDPTKSIILDNLPSRPEGGWKLFDNYIGNGLKNKNIHVGRFKLKFKIDENGQPTTIEVLETSHRDASDILTDLLKNGPKWIQGTSNSTVEIEIKL